MSRPLSRALVGIAAWLLADLRPTLAKGLKTEVEYIDGEREALVFAAGAVTGAARMRFSLASGAAVVVAGGIAASAAVYGCYHLIAPLGPMCAKLELMSGAGGACLAASSFSHEVIAQTDSVIWASRLFSLAGVGVLVLAAAASLVLGKIRLLYRTAGAALGLALLTGITGLGALESWAGYIAQIGGLCLAGAALQMLVRWDTRRMQGIEAARSRERDRQ